MKIVHVLFSAANSKDIDEISSGQRNTGVLKRFWLRGGLTGVDLHHRHLTAKKFYLWQVMWRGRLGGKILRAGGIEQAAYPRVATQFCPSTSTTLCRRVVRWGGQP